MNDVPHITILYDASCVFCNLCREFVEKRQKKVVFLFQDIQNGEAESIMLDPYGLKLEKFAACLYIAKKLRQPWPVIAYVLGIVPKGIGDWGYDWVSRNRDFLMKLAK